jgi:hypothetical protein
MQFDEEDYTPVDSLKNKTEARIMILFLECEIRRHTEDIRKSSNKILEIRRKFGLGVEWVDK